MGMCRICGKNFGLMGGGSEPYTGHNLQVCNSCGEVLKKIDKVKNEDTQEVKDLFVSVMSMTDDADVKQILTDYSKSIISDSEKLVAITNESKEKAERAQNIEENFYDLEKAFRVTTGYDFEGYQIVDYTEIQSQYDSLQAERDNLQQQVDAKKAAEEQAARAAQQQQWEQESQNNEETVYWVAGGECYHSTPNCATLKRSSNIMSGSVSSAGGRRPCKVYLIYKYLFFSGCKHTPSPPGCCRKCIFCKSGFSALRF